MTGGLGESGDLFHITNLCEDTGERLSVDETIAIPIFLAPLGCEIIDLSMEVTTAVTAATANHWTINIANQNGDGTLLSDDFDTDSDESGNGGRSFVADTMLSLNDNGAGTNYLQTAVLAKGDMLILTATKAASATALANPVVVVRYRI